MIDVVAAVIKNQEGKYLITQRNFKKVQGGLWEFPGGKVEEGETEHHALLREIREEMDWDIYVGHCIGSITHEYPDFSITLTAYLCKGGDGDFKMLKHLDCKWLTLEELPSLKWTEGDRKLLTML